ncbi:MAG: M20/M25/M40 family metallo-hydrolase, partial [Anaerotignum sp.]|nr:M20/M25/M40 family metallo-hydrolase [Anaerotignum sp.]
IHGGEACNIVAKEVRIEGTMRAFSDEVYEKMVQRVEEAVKFIAAGYGCEGIVTFNHMYRVVNNDEALVRALEEACGESYLTTQPYMLAEDFSFFQQVVPGLFFFLGAKNTEKGFIHPLHSAEFDFDEKILCFGVETYMNLLVTLGMF